MNYQFKENPKVGISHITKSVFSLYEKQIKNSDSLLFVTSSQPNSSPHIGTITTFSTTFSLARYARDLYGKDVSIVVDLLDNAPSKKIEGENEVIQLSLADDIVDGQSIYEKHLLNYKDLLEGLSGAVDDTKLPPFVFNNPKVFDQFCQRANQTQNFVSLAQ